MMMIIFSLYFPILLSLSLSFLLHAFKKHIHYYFFVLASTVFKSANNATDNNKIHLKCNHSVLDSETAANPAPPPPPPSPIRFVDDIGGEIYGFMSCTESLGFESSDERRVDDQIDDDNDNDDNNDDIDDKVEDEGECWRMTRAAEGRGNWRKLDSFPPPLSSLNDNGQRSFNLVAVRENGRLQLNKVRIKRPEILYASREDGRLRLYLVPDLDYAEEEEYEEEEEEEEEEEIVEEDVARKTEEEIIVESESESEEEEEEEDEMVEEIIRNEQQDRIGEWKFPIGGNEGFRRCHQVVNLNHHHHHHHVIHSSHHHHYYHHLHMYGIGIA